MNVKLDLDGVKTMRACRDWSREAHVLLDVLRLRVRSCRWFITRKGSHVILKLHRNLNPTETVALQAILGSDRFREAANLRRVRKRIDAWNVMFTAKYMRRAYYAEVPCAKRAALMLHNIGKERRWELS